MLLGFAANVQHSAPTQTVNRVKQALATLKNIERIACDQHDQLRFANAWMLTSRGVAQALDCDFRLVSPCSGPAAARPNMFCSVRFKTKATFWSSVDLHAAVMPRICEALGRTLLLRRRSSEFAPGIVSSAASHHADHNHVAQLYRLSSSSSPVTLGKECRRRTCPLPNDTRVHHSTRPLQDVAARKTAGHV